MISVLQKQALAPHTTMKVGGVAKWFAQAQSIHEVVDAVQFASAHGVPLIVLGGGSNTIFRDGVIDALVLHIDIKGFDIQEESDESVLVVIGAGEDWDETVSRVVHHGWSGIEALSLIPGYVGAAPIQNIGAYGSEVKNVIEWVNVFDTKIGSTVKLKNSECRFRYRDSIFKSEERGRYIITHVAFRFSKKLPAMPEYAAVKEYFGEHNQGYSIGRPTLTQIREAIIAIRTSKLPDPKELPNAGSFFKNPIVSSEHAEYLKKRYPDMAMTTLLCGKAKIYAGWLIEQTGFKGERMGPVGMYEKQALVLVNYGGATVQDIKKLSRAIQTAVSNKYGLELEREPVIH